MLKLGALPPEPPEAKVWLTVSNWNKKIINELRVSQTALNELGPGPTPVYIMQNHATLYCKYYQLQVLDTLFSPILGQVYSLDREHTSCTVYTVVFMLIIRIESGPTHLTMWVRIEIGFRIATIYKTP